MLSIKEYIDKNPQWVDGSDTTYKKVMLAIQTGRLKGRKYGKTYKIAEGEEDNVYSEFDSIQELKNKHLLVKIKKDEQSIYETRALLAEKVCDLILEELFNTKIGILNSIATKYLSDEGKKIWNQEIKNGWNQKSPIFRERLRLLVTE